MTDSAIRQQISREVKRALSEAGLSAHAASLKMGKDRKLIYRWINKEVTAPLDQLARFAEHVGPIWLEVGGQTEEAAPPPWVERLLAGVMALETNAPIRDEELAQAQARAATYLAANTRKRPRQVGGGGAAGSSS